MYIYQVLHINKILSIDVSVPSYSNSVKCQAHRVFYQIFSSLSSVVVLRCTEVVQASTYFPCTTASDCPGTCYFKAERPICGIEVIDGYLARICVCVGQCYQ